jgi:hypothetical protein
VAAKSVQDNVINDNVNRTLNNFTVFAFKIYDSVRKTRANGDIYDYALLQKASELYDVDLLYFTLL